MKKGLWQCPFCNNGKKDFFIETFDRLNPEKRYVYWRCLNCNLVFLENRKDNNNFYTYNLDKKINLIKRFTMWLVYRKIKRLKPMGDLLDFGCGTGYLLKYLSSKKYNVEGIEFDKRAIRIAKNVHGLAVYSKWKNKKYDIILINHVLEHLPNPKNELEIIKSHLKEDGIIVVRIPNINSRQFKIFGGKWFHLDAPRHLNHFYKGSFYAIAKSAGLKIFRSDYFNIDIDPLGWYFSIFGFPKKGFKGFNPLELLILAMTIPLTIIDCIFKSTADITYILNKKT